MIKGSNENKVLYIWLFSVLFLSVFLVPVTADIDKDLPSYLQQANYRTAQRSLELARESIISLDYTTSYDFVITGLAYDQSISDLWYLKALLLSLKDAPLFEVKNAVALSLEKSSWLYYKADAAKVLYAKVLVKTGECEKAVSLLDEKPMVFNSEAEYWRAVSYYRLGDFQKSREIIASARKIFPHDTRFPLLFFSQERFTYDDTDTYFKELLGNLLNMVTVWKDEEPQILLYASYYVESELRTRYLKEYRISNPKNPLYIAASLENGLISEKNAVENLFFYADDIIDGSVFFEVLSLIHSEAAFLYVIEKLEAYSGSLVFDTTKDGENDFFVTYKYGRPSSVSFDENADGNLQWLAELDYGVPVKITSFDQNFDLYYNRYPYIESVNSITQENEMRINLINGSTDWKPFELEQIPLVGNLVFYLPSLLPQVEFIPRTIFFQNASEIVVSSGPNNEDRIRFSMKDSAPKTAVYTKDGTPWAYSFFEDGILVFRNIDKDRNGTYETSQMFTFDPLLSNNYISDKQTEVMYKELFGLLPANKGLFVSKTIADTNDNSITDFMEEYGEGDLKKTSWDSDEDGIWDITYEKNSDGKKIKEKVSFINPIDNEEVSIFLVDKEPVNVLHGSKNIAITKDNELPFFWIGEVPDSSYALIALNELQELNTQGIRLLVKPESPLKGLILAIKVDSLFFGEYIHD